MVEKITRGLYEAEKRIAINQGRGADIAHLTDDDVLPKYTEAVYEKRDIQERSLSEWLDYLERNDAHHPTWFRYFVVRNLDKMGTLNKEKGEYAKRTNYTVAPFPELNSGALGFVYRMLDTGIGSNEFVPVEAQGPEQQAEAVAKREKLATLIEKKDFNKLYVFALENAGSLNRESLQGEWRKFERGSDYRVLENTLRGKDTGWCTAEGSALAHVKAGDFYVYFTKSPSGLFSEPRIAIRMEGDTVAEVRGVNKRQELEPALVEIAQAQYTQLPGGERFDKKSADMKQVTVLVQKQEKSIPFTKDDLRFLYELDSPIEGFGYVDDPRIAALRRGRDRQKDIETMCDCPPEFIATDTQDIAETTQVFCADKGAKISFVDFREEKNQAKLSQIIEFNKAFKETGSPARLDVAIEGGIVPLELTQDNFESLRTYETAIKAYENTDGGSPSWAGEELKDIQWTPPNHTSLAIHILDHGSTTPVERNQLVLDMDKVGYRVLTFSELVALGITKPELNKRGEILNTYEKHTLHGDSQVPLLNWNGDKRLLDASHSDDDWNERNRFLFVRK